MKGILTNFGKFTKKQNPPDKPQVRYGRTEFSKVVFSLDVFSTFLGQLRTKRLVLRPKTTGGEEALDRPTPNGEGEEYNNKE